MASETSSNFNVRSDAKRRNLLPEAFEERNERALASAGADDARDAFGPEPKNLREAAAVKE